MEVLSGDGDAETRRLLAELEIIENDGQGSSRPHHEHTTFIAQNDVSRPTPRFQQHQQQHLQHQPQHLQHQPQHLQHQSQHLQQHDPVDYGRRINKSLVLPPETSLAPQQNNGTAVHASSSAYSSCSNTSSDVNVAQQGNSKAGRSRRHHGASPCSSSSGMGRDSRQEQQQQLNGRAVEEGRYNARLAERQTMSQRARNSSSPQQHAHRQQFRSSGSETNLVHTGRLVSAHRQVGASPTPQYHHHNRRHSSQSATEAARRRDVIVDRLPPLGAPVSRYGHGMAAASRYSSSPVSLSLPPSVMFPAPAVSDILQQRARHKSPQNMMQHQSAGQQRVHSGTVGIGPTATFTVSGPHHGVAYAEACVLPRHVVHPTTSTSSSHLPLAAPLPPSLQREVDAVMAEHSPRPACGSPADSERTIYGVCNICQDAVTDASTACIAQGHLHHSGCFFCCVCCRPLLHRAYYNVNGRVYCEEDYLHCGFKQTAEICSVCALPITAMILHAVGRAFHPACFRCTSCSSSLDGVPFTVGEEGSVVYCVECYHKVFAPRCAKCRKPIGPLPGSDETVRVVSMNNDYHIDCFICERCGLQLTDEAGRRCYPLDGRLFCQHCHVTTRRQQPNRTSNNVAVKMTSAEDSTIV